MSDTTTSASASKSTKVGDIWTIDVPGAGEDGVLVEFAKPSGDPLTVLSTPDADGKHHASIALSDEGEWTATIPGAKKPETVTAK